MIFLRKVRVEYIVGDGQEEKGISPMTPTKYRVRSRHRGGLSKRNHNYIRPLVGLGPNERLPNGFIPPPACLRRRFAAERRSWNAVVRSRLAMDDCLARGPGFNSNPTSSYAYYESYSISTKYFVHMLLCILCIRARSIEQYATTVEAGMHNIMHSIICILYSTCTY